MKKKLISVIGALALGIVTVALMLTTLSASAASSAEISAAQAVNPSSFPLRHLAVTNTVYLPLVSKPAPLAISGGTYYDRHNGLIGTAFLFDPNLSGGQRVSYLDIRGPSGWNSNQAFRLYPYMPQGIAQNRATGWIFTTPFSGIYTATAQIISGPAVTTTFEIDASSQNTAPVIMSVLASSTQVHVNWSAPSDTRSFLVRLERVPFNGVIAETILAGSETSYQFSGLSLTSGDTYRVVLFAFSRDLMTPDAVTNPYNISSDNITFTR